MSSLVSKFQLSKFRPINVSVGIIAIIILLYLLVWFSSPWLFRYVIEDILRPLNLSLTEESHFRYNPFTASLYVDKLSFSNDSGRVFHLEHSILDINLISLVNREIEVDTFNIQGLELVVDLNADGTVISGIPLPATDSSADDKSLSGEEKHSLVKDLVLLMPELTVTESKIIIKKGDLHRFIEIHDFKISNANLAELDQVFDLSLHVSIDKAPFILDLKAELHEGSASVAFSTSLDKFMLGVLEPEIKDVPFEVAGKLSFDISGSAELHSSLSTLLIDSSRISVSDLSVSNDEFLFYQESMGLEIKSVGYKINKKQQKLAELEIEVSMSKTALSNKISNDVLVQFEAFSSSLISIELQPESALESAIVDVSELAIDNIVLSNINAEKTPALITLSSLRVNDVDYANNHLKVAVIKMADVKSQILIDKDKNMTTLAKIPATDAVKQQAAAENNSTEAAGDEENAEKNHATDFKIKLDRIELTGENVVTFHDASVEPAHKRTVVIEKAFIDKISNHENTPSPFEFTARTNKYTSIILQGAVSPFTETTNLTLKGTAREFSLPTISSYIKEPLGFEINSGQLDADFDVAIVESVIEGELKLIMRGADMTSANDHQANSMKDKTMIPLNVALGMLKDGDGNIEINVPLDGRVDAPGFGVNGLIVLVAKKAALSQAKSYLVNAFVPYASVVSVALVAGDYALKLRFEDLPYAAASVDIVEQQQEYLSQFIALLKDKPGKQVRVCGIATPADINQPTGVQLSDPVHIKLARDFSNHRAQAFKQYVIEKGGIKSGRLLICAPQIDFEENALPRIELSI